jgi:hypothetical protein
LAASRQDLDAILPTLARDGYRITSPSNDQYNCVAWVGRSQSAWWEPALAIGTWFRKVDESELDEGDMDEYIALFEFWGYKRCQEGSLETGVEKIAVFGSEQDFDHVAYQRPDGDWSSKLGPLNDIRHPCVESLVGKGGMEYRPIVVFMSRARLSHELADSETGLLIPAS